MLRPLKNVNVENTKIKLFPQDSRVTMTNVEDKPGIKSEKSVCIDVILLDRRINRSGRLRAKDDALVLALQGR